MEKSNGYIKTRTGLITVGFLITILIFGFGGVISNAISLDDEVGENSIGVASLETNFEIFEKRLDRFEEKLDKVLGI